VDYPNDDCREAYECGQEFCLAGTPAQSIPSALVWWETHLEKVYFLMGMIMEIKDMQEARTP
jgi:hypothetical protein